MKNTGKYLEAIVSSIEKCLVTIPDTKVIRDVKITDRDGHDRQIDIYVELNANRKTLKYAIECKQYTGTNRVQMKDVIDFHGTINSNGIQGIMVTTSDFTANALNKAKNLGIQTFRIAPHNKTNLKAYKIFYKTYKIKSGKLKSEHFKLSKNPSKEDIYEGKKQRYKNNQFFEQFLVPIIRSNLNTKWDQFYDSFYEEDKEDGFGLFIRKKKSQTFRGNLENIHFKYKNKFYPIKTFIITIDFWMDIIEENNPSPFAYYDLQEQKNYVNFFAQSIQLEPGVKAYLNLVELVDTDNVKIDLVTNDPKKQKEIIFHDFGKFDPKDLSFEITNDEEE